MSSTEVQTPVSASKPVRVLGTVLAVLVAVQGYLATIDGIPDWVKLVIGGVTVVLTVGLSKWTENKTVPYENVAARYIDQTGEIVAGPASDQRIPNGTVVSVTTPEPQL
jgi:hypothetical protein